MTAGLQLPSRRALPGRRPLGSATRLLAAAGLAAGVLGAGGCASSGDGDVAASPRTAWVPPAAAVPAPEAAPAAGPGRPLDLVALTDIALEHNQGTRLAWLAAKSAAAQRLQAGSAWLPQVSVGFSRQEQALGSIPGLPPGLAAGGSRSITYGPTYSINQLIYDFGGTQGNMAAARAALFAADFSYNQTLQDTMLAVQVDYYQTIAADSALQAAQVALQDAKTGLDLAATRRKVGLAAPGDQLRAESNLRSAEFQVEQQTAALEQSRAALAEVLGIAITPDFTLAPPPPPPPAPELARDVASITREAIARRPDLLAAVATLQARTEALRAARSGYLPSLSTSLSGQRQYLHGAPGNPSDNWTFSLNLNWSIFDGLNTQSRIDAARAQLDSARQAVLQQEVAIVADVWTQYYSLQSAAKQVASARAALDAANEALQVVEQGYRSGLNPLTDLLGAQKDLAAARQQKIQADTGLAVALARMAHVTGALEAPPPGVAPAP